MRLLGQREMRLEASSKHQYRGIDGGDVKALTWYFVGLINLSASRQGTISKLLLVSYSCDIMSSSGESVCVLPSLTGEILKFQERLFFFLISRSGFSPKDV